MAIKLLASGLVVFAIGGILSIPADPRIDNVDSTWLKVSKIMGITLIVSGALMAFTGVFVGIWGM